MAVVAVNKNGTEVIGEDLTRCGLDKNHWLVPMEYLSKIEPTFWASIYNDPDEGWRDVAVELPKGSIKKLIGRELTWEDEPVELT